MTAAGPLTWGAGLSLPRIWSKPYQSESKSAGRSRFSLRNCSHELGQSSATGTLTAAHAIAPPAAARQNARICPARQHSASSGTKKSTG